MTREKYRKKRIHPKERLHCQNAGENTKREGIDRFIRANQKKTQEDEQQQKGWLYSQSS